LRILQLDIQGDESPEPVGNLADAREVFNF
jgi:hypothetical protein